MRLDAVNPPVTAGEALPSLRVPTFQPAQQKPYHP